MRASAVPFRLPVPRWRPIRRARFSSRARIRECIVVGFLMMRPSETNFRMVCRELALPISVISLGSSQTLFLPQPRTDAARRFCVVRFGLESQPIILFLAVRIAVSSPESGEVEWTCNG